MEFETRPFSGPAYDDVEEKNKHDVKDDMKEDADNDAFDHQVEALIEAVPANARGHVKTILAALKKAARGRKTILFTARKYRNVIKRLNTLLAVNAGDAWKQHGFRPNDRDLNIFLVSEKKHAEKTIEAQAAEIEELKRENWYLTETIHRLKN